MITIDGSMGEGGGQIIRTALALSLVTGRSFAINNIRAGRKKPGLLRQHLTAVNAAQEIGCAEVSGNRLKSQSLTFTPRAVKGGTYRFSIGSAGSCTLVLQTVLPALMTADQPSELVLEGGTHNPFAPPFDFLELAFLPVINRMGPHIAVTLDRPGFYPAGGGQFHASIEPAKTITSFDLSERGELVRPSARALVSNLSRSIAEREIKVVRNALRLRKSAAKVVELEGSTGPGNVLSIIVESQQVTEVFTGFGQLGVRAETVAEGAVKQAQQYLATDAAVSSYLADQLLIPMALAGSGQFTTLVPTPHTTTNVDVIQRFLDVQINFEQINERTYRCSIE